MKPKRFSPTTRKKLIQAIQKSPTYRKAYQDPDFIGREELRPIRLELELLKPEMALTKHDIRSTIIAFGSARFPAPEDGRKHIASLRRKLRARPRKKSLGC